MMQQPMGKRLDVWTPECDELLAAVRRSPRRKS